MPERAAWLEGRIADVISLTQALVRAPSPNPPGDERAAAATVAGYLGGLPGVDVRTLGPSAERPSVVFGVGDGQPTLVLAAHLDTHPVDAAWTREPLVPELDGERLYGLGTTDNKGAVAAMAVVFRAFAEAGCPVPGRLLLIANADEETGGGHGIAHVRDSLGEPLDAVVVAEPSGIDASYERLYVAARGASRFRLAVAGTDTHSSLADREGIESAVERLLVVLRVVRASLPLLEERHPVYGLAPILIVVRVDGGVGWGVVPGRATAELELRVTPGHAQDDVERAIRAAVDAAAAAVGAPVELDFADGSLRWMAPSDIPASDPLVVAARAAWADVLGAEPALGCFPGGTDARLFTERGVPTLSGVGPGALVRAHRPDEYVTVGELETAARLYAAIVDHFLEPEGDR